MFAIPSAWALARPNITGYGAPTTAPETEYAIMELVHVTGLTVVTRAN